LVEPLRRETEDVSVEEPQGSQRLVLRRRADLPFDSKPGQEPGDVFRPQVTRMTLTVKQDVSLDPADICLLCPAAEVTRPDLTADCVEQPRPACVLGATFTGDAESVRQRADRGRRADHLRSA